MGSIDKSFKIMSLQEYSTIMATRQRETSIFKYPIRIITGIILKLNLEITSSSNISMRKNDEYLRNQRSFSIFSKLSLAKDN